MRYIYTITLASINWLNIFRNLNAKEAVNLFYSIIYEIINIFVTKIIKRPSNYPSQYGENSKHFVFKEKNAYELFTNTGSAIDYNNFSRLRAEFKIKKTQKLITEIIH